MNIGIIGKCFRLPYGTRPQYEPSLHRIEQLRFEELTRPTCTPLNCMAGRDEA